jgi:hypothetical protein
MNKILVAMIVVAGAAASASAGITYPFINITGNSAYSAAAGAAQLSVTVVDHSPGKVAFTFNNAGPDQMSITDVYFHAPSFTSISTIVNGPGVNYTAGATPSNLPGGNSISPAFVTTLGLSADSAPPPVANGVQPGEWLTIVLNLAPAKSYNDIISELDGGIAARVGIHVQSFQNGQSESFVTPAPGAVALVGLGGLMAARRRR